MLTLNLPHLPVGMWRRCQVFLPGCCVWPCCFPLNETWLTAMLTESIKFKLLILCHKPRETDFSYRLLCCRRAEIANNCTRCAACFSHALQGWPGAWMAHKQLCKNLPCSWGGSKLLCCLHLATRKLPPLLHTEAEIKSLRFLAGLRKWATLSSSQIPC